MFYRITKRSKGKWAVTAVHPGWITPLGVKKTKEAAITLARLLAGHSVKIVVIE